MEPLGNQSAVVASLCRRTPKAATVRKDRLSREVVGRVEVDVGAIEFVCLEDAEWRRVDVNRDQVLATYVWISQLMNVRDGCISNLTRLVFLTRFIRKTLRGSKLNVVSHSALRKPALRLASHCGRELRALSGSPTQHSISTKSLRTTRWRQYFPSLNARYGKRSSRSMAEFASHESSCSSEANLPAFERRDQICQRVRISFRFRIC